MVPKWVGEMGEIRELQNKMNSISVKRPLNKFV